jgi:hypothetical protein
MIDYDGKEMQFSYRSNDAREDNEETVEETV